MYNECNCGNSQSLEIRGPSRRHHPKETSETASPRFIPSILCSEFTSQTTVSCSSGTFNPRNGRNASRNFMSPSSVKGGHTSTWYSRWIKAKLILPVHCRMCPCKTRQFKRQPLKSLSEDTYSESANSLRGSTGLIWITRTVQDTCMHFY